MLRHDQSKILDSITTDVPHKQSIAKDLQEMSLKEARKARQQGIFKRASDDLYENVATKEFWKINKESGMVERVITVDKNGIITE